MAVQNPPRTAADRPPAAGWARRPAVLRRLALATLVANVAIVVTGGAVRLTGSGLGCPTWPSCTDASLTPTREYAAHGVIEFANRQLTFVLGLLVLATLVAAVLARRQIRLAVLVAASIPAQAVLGGITVLTHLNPWTVAAHFGLSMLIIAAAFALWWRLRDDPGPPGGTSTALRTAAWLITALTAAVLAVGTVVTGSGPHAGDKGATHRIGFDPAAVSQLHADLVMLLIGISLGFAVLTQAAGASARLRRAGWLLVAVELAQGLIGFVQYFSHVPAVLVGFHMLGACLVWLAALTVLARTPATGPRATSASARELVGRQP
ncbi:COX15/CtaA family protein [Jatrophihabitans sp.]|uniref:COX15/CtaA family protein n=1 Tax=Jatrophihabitans sp. TaxID=1932789 RepID=UPI002BA22EB6|nr:COX15/CtaA family protein [Jatrophihabitans sp.]